LVNQIAQLHQADGRLIGACHRASNGISDSVPLGVQAALIGLETAS